MKSKEALINYLSNHFSMHRARIVLMVEMILSIIKTGNVQQQKIASGTNLQAKSSSIVRRIQRFFAEQIVSQVDASRLIYSMFTWPDKITLTMDRTNWKFGRTDINFLVLGAVYKGSSIPLVWMLLPHQGNSDTQIRISLMERLLAMIPAEKIECLLADREFIGGKWFSYLLSKKIPFSIRIKESATIQNMRQGGRISFKKLLQGLSVGQVKELHQNVSGLMLNIATTRTKTGELLIVASSSINCLGLEIYAQRWTIETMFKSLKTAGFNMEDTHQKNPDRLSKLMVLVTIAYAWSIKIGDVKNEIRPIKIKNNTRKEFSLFAYGMRTIQTILLKSHSLTKKLMQLIQTLALNKHYSQHLARVTVVY